MTDITNNFQITGQFARVKSVGEDHRRQSQKRRSPYISDTNVKLSEEDKEDLHRIIKEQDYTLSGFIREAFYVARLFDREVRAAILAHPERVTALFTTEIEERP